MWGLFMRVLCIDDEKTFATNMKMWLSPQLSSLDWTYVPTLALGLAALSEAVLYGNPYDVLVLDLLLPGETLGVLSFPKLRENFPNLTIIGLTAGSNFSDTTFDIGKKISVAKKAESRSLILNKLKEIENSNG